MKIKRPKVKSPGIPISSMSDISFLLLIFIMLLSLINYRKEIKIDYPEARAIEVTQDKNNFEIWIDKDGIIYYKGEQITQDALENVLLDAIAKKPATRVHILADKNTPYKNVNGVMKILQLVQHRVVSLVVKD